MGGEVRPPRPPRPSQPAPGRRKAVAPQKPLTTAAPACRVPPAPAQVLGRVEESPEEIKARLLEKKVARRRLLIWRLMWVLLSVAAIAAVVWVALFSPLFAVQETRLEIEAPETIDVAPTASVMQKHVGTSLFLVSSGALREEILKDPHIAEATITKTWPDGLHVALIERVPVIGVKVEGGYDLVAADAVTVTTVNDVPEQLPLLTTDQEIAATTVSQIGEILEALPTDISDQVSEVSLSGGIYTLHVANGSQIIWGDPSDAALKSQVLQLLVQQRPSSIYDVADPQRPSIR